MIAVIVLFQLTDDFVAGNLQLVSQKIKIIGHLGLHLLFTDTAEGSVWLVHADILNVVQFAENTQLRELRDACQEHETQIRVARLERAVEVPHHVPKRGQVLLFMDHVEKRSVIFVYQYDYLSVCLFKRAFYQIRQTHIGISIRYAAVIFPLIFGQHIVQHLFQTLFIHVFRHAHVEMKHGIREPFLLQFFNGKTFEQFFTTFEIRMKRAGEQALSKAARAAQKYIT